MVVQVGLRRRTGRRAADPRRPAGRGRTGASSSARGAVGEVGDPPGDPQPGERAGSRVVVVAAAPSSGRRGWRRVAVRLQAIWSPWRGAGGQHETRRRRGPGCPTAHSSARMPPIDPPTHRGERSMPSWSASAASAWHLVADGDPGEARAPRPAVGRERGRAGRALAAAEHVGGDDEPLVGVERRARADQPVPPAGCRLARAGRADHVRSRRSGRAATSTALSPRRGSSRAPNVS